MVTIGILALQGAFIEHQHMLESLHVKTFQIRQRKDIDQPMDGLILPGGESTAMGKLLKDLGLLITIREKILHGLPVMGTCAGMILLAKSIDHEQTTHLGLMDITVCRNAYGRQLSSFSTEDLFDSKKIPMTFIRAPYIKDYKDIDILSVVDGKLVAARQNNILVTAFHPELTHDTTVHKYFLKMVTSLS